MDRRTREGSDEERGGDGGSFRNEEVAFGRPDSRSAQHSPDRGRPLPGAGFRPGGGAKRRGIGAADLLLPRPLRHDGLPRLLHRACGQHRLSGHDLRSGTSGPRGGRNGVALLQHRARHRTDLGTFRLGRLVDLGRAAHQHPGPLDDLRRLPPSASYMENDPRMRRYAAVLGIIGALDVPIVYFSCSGFARSIPRPSS